MTRVEDEAGLIRLGESLGASLPQQAVVWLEGELGAGKTTLVRALAAARGAALAATSPTFNLVHRYDGPRGPVFHVDCYRLRTPDEAAELHWEDMETTGDLLLVEWPERGGSWVAPPMVRIRLDHVADIDRRRVTVTRLVPEAG
jgi:tRNA threonylcarbamoyladenosine biosynthesis protein TsaE